MVSFEEIKKISEDKRQAALCTLIETTGSTPRKAGAKMLVVNDNTTHGQIRGTIGGGAVEHSLRKHALASLKTRKPVFIELALTHDLGMCCGGKMSFFIEPIYPEPSCAIFGAGHIGESLCRLATQAGFTAFVLDPRTDLLNKDRFSSAYKLLPGYGDKQFELLPFGSNFYSVVTTHDHQTDQTLIEKLMKHDFQYIGLVGSRRKAKLTSTRCLNRGIAQEKVDQLHCPAGLKINAQTPEEIAFSIVSQMIQTRRQLDD